MKHVIIFIRNNITQKRSKSWDARFYCLRDQATQNHFDLHWDKSKHNDADYWTKKFPASRHKKIRQRYVLEINLVLPGSFRHSPYSLTCKGVLVREIRSIRL